MSYPRLRIGTIPVTAKLLLYTLLTISVISGVIGSVLLRAADTSNSFLEIFIIGLVSLLAGIGFIAIILGVAKRWQFVGGAIFLSLALFILFSLPSGYNMERSFLHDYPYLIVPLLVTTLSWAISGVIIIIRGKDFLVEKGS